MLRSGAYLPYDPDVELPGMQGATCSGGLDEESKHFQPIKGIWDIETTTLQTGGEMLRYRVAECSEGHKLIRGTDSSYTRDQCDACEYGKFALGKAIYDPFHEKRNEQCFDCTEITGLQCKGGLHLHVHPCPHDSLHECVLHETANPIMIFRSPTGREISPEEGFWMDPMVRVYNGNVE